MCKPFWFFLKNLVNEHYSPWHQIGIFHFFHIAASFVYAYYCRWPLPVLYVAPSFPFCRHTTFALFSGFFSYYFYTQHHIHICSQIPSIFPVNVTLYTHSNKTTYRYSESTSHGMRVAQVVTLCKQQKSYILSALNLETFCSCLSLG